MRLLSIVVEKSKMSLCKFHVNHVFKYVDIRLFQQRKILQINSVTNWLKQELKKLYSL